MPVNTEQLLLIGDVERVYDVHPHHRTDLHRQTIVLRRVHHLLHHNQHLHVRQEDEPDKRVLDEDAQSVAKHKKIAENDDKYVCFVYYI